MLENKKHVEKLFKNSEKFRDKDGLLYIPKILEAIEKIDMELIKILKNDEKTKKYFFTQVDDVFVLNQNKLIEFFTLKNKKKNGSTEGVVKSPFFKDTAVSKEVSPCPFSLLIVHLIYTG